MRAAAPSPASTRDIRIRAPAFGVWGYEFGPGPDDGRLLSPERRRDLMSYCLPAGISDFNFAMALDYRYGLSTAAQARPDASPRETLATVTLTGPEGSVAAGDAEWGGGAAKRGAVGGASCKLRFTYL